MIRQRIRDRLVSLSDERFERALAALGVPAHQVSGRAAPRYVRTEDALDWLERRGGLDVDSESVLEHEDAAQGWDLRLRDEVVDMFRLLGFEVEGDDDSEVPFRAQQRIGPLSMELLVTVWSRDTHMPAGAVADFQARLLAARGTRPHLGGAIVARHGFEQSARELAERLGIQTRSVQETSRALIPLEPYAANLIRQFQDSPLAKHYIPLDVIHPREKAFWLSGAVLPWQKSSETKRPQHDPVTKLARKMEAMSAIVEHKAHASLDLQLTRWVGNDTSSYLIVFGDYGTGKTSSVEAFAAAQAQRFLDDIETCRCPIVVPLKEFVGGLSESSLLAYLVRELKAPHLTWNIFDSFVKRKRIVLLLDGFDEMGFQIDHRVRRLHFSSVFKLASIPGSKVVITGRPGYFPCIDELSDIFDVVGDDEGLNGGAESVLLELAPLSQSQIEGYLASFGMTLPLGAIARVQGFIDTVYDLRDLTERPFLLDLIVKTLASLETATDGVTPARLYGLYTARWIDRELAKGESRWLIGRKEKRAFMQEIAWRMMQHNSFKVHFSVLSEWVRAHVDVKNADAVDHLAHDIRTCSFLMRDDEGYYTFVHRSFMEYFVALKLVEAARHGEAFDQVLAGEAFAKIARNILVFAVDVIGDDAPVLASLLKAVLGGVITVRDLFVQFNQFTISRRGRLAHALLGCGELIVDDRLRDCKLGTCAAAGNSSCSFCGQSFEPKGVVFGPNVSVCSRCVSEALACSWWISVSSFPHPLPHGRSCSFCARTLGSVNYFLEKDGGGPTICDTCIALCSDVLTQERAQV